MKKQPGPMRDKVLAMFDADPKLTSYAIGDAVGMDSRHVRQTLKRHGRKLARKRGHRELPEAIA
jgi:hypothetical protein